LPIFVLKEEGLKRPTTKEGREKKGGKAKTTRKRGEKKNMFLERGTPQRKSVHGKKKGRKGTAHL